MNFFTSRYSATQTIEQASRYLKVKMSWNAPGTLPYRIDVEATELFASYIDEEGSIHPLRIADLRNGNNNPLPEFRSRYFDYLNMVSLTRVRRIFGALINLAKKKGKTEGIIFLTHEAPDQVSSRRLLADWLKLFTGFEMKELEHHKSDVKLGDNLPAVKSYYCWLNPATAPHNPGDDYMRARALIITASSPDEARKKYRTAPQLQGWLIPEEMRYFEAIEVTKRPGNYWWLDKDGNHYSADEL